jgi:hypothetical protein
MHYVTVSISLEVCTFVLYNVGERSPKPELPMRLTPSAATVGVKGVVMNGLKQEHKS